MVVLGLVLPEFGLEQKGVRHRDFVARVKSGDDLDSVVVGLAGLDLALLEAVLGAYEDNPLALDGLQSLFQDPGWHGVVRYLHLSGHEGSGTPGKLRVGQSDDDTG